MIQTYEYQISINTKNKRAVFQCLILVLFREKTFSGSIYSLIEKSCEKLVTVMVESQNRNNCSFSKLKEALQLKNIFINGVIES